nr:carboxypeptidase-like regulatory domain-containing protein [Pedobacter panaciterrae]
MIRIWMLIFLIGYFTAVKAQTRISGFVYSQGNATQGINVTVKAGNAATVLAYSVSNDKGAYTLDFKSTADSVTITVSGFNFKKQSSVVLNRSQSLNFNVIAQVINLKEIKVTPPRIHKLNDTLNYLVDGFTDKNDRTIGDVLKKMPGIKVNDDGSITYNDKPINKFYIENRDLLQGKYGIATNNLEAKDVATVQVLENHQPVKALKDREFIDQGAINLKLKDSAKGVLVGNAQLGTGMSPLLWNNELFSSYFNKKRQNMNTYKGNNSGDDVGAELNSFYLPNIDPSQRSLLSVQSPSPPSISQKRYLFNRVNAATVNQLWTYGKDVQITANISYLNDRQKKNSYSRTGYYLASDSLLSIEENLAATEHIDLLDASIQLNVNREQYYLDNSLKVTGKWNREVGDVYSADTVIQELNKPVFKISNTFNMIKNYKKSAVKIYAYTEYSSNPHTLDVRPMLYTELFPEALKSDRMKQLVARNEFLSVNQFSFGLGQGAFKQNYTVGVSARLQSLNSQLEAISLAGQARPAADSLSNNLNWNKYEVYVTPDYNYVHRNFRVTLKLPFVYNMLQTNNELNADNTVFEDKDTQQLFFNPSLNMRYELGLFWNLSAGVSYKNDQGNIDNGFGGYVMQSYRNLIRNDGQVPHQKKQSYNLDLGYRHPLYAVFFNLGARYLRNKMNLLYSFDYQGILSLRKSYNIANIAEGYNIYAVTSKGIDKLGATVRLEANYTNSAGTQISEGRLINFVNEQYVIRPEISSKIGQWASLSYSLQAIRSSNKLSKVISDYAPIQTRTHRGQLNFFPARNITLNVAYENFYNNAIVSGSRTSDFADLGVKFKFKKMELKLDYVNILNTKQYTSAVYNEINTYYWVYNLRPAQLLMKVRFKIK